MTAQEEMLKGPWKKPAVSTLTDTVIDSFSTLFNAPDFKPDPSVKDIFTGFAEHVGYDRHEGLSSLALELQVLAAGSVLYRGATASPSDAGVSGDGELVDSPAIDLRQSHLDRAEDFASITGQISSPKPDTVLSFFKSRKGGMDDAVSVSKAIKHLQTAYGGMQATPWPLVGNCWESLRGRRCSLRRPPQIPRRTGKGLSVNKPPMMINLEAAQPISTDGGHNNTPILNCQSPRIIQKCSAHGRRRTGLGISDNPHTPVHTYNDPLIWRCMQGECSTPPCIHPSLPFWTSTSVPSFRGNAVG